MVEFTKEHLKVLLEKMFDGSFAKLAERMKKLGRPELTETKLREIIGQAGPERKKDWDGGVSYYEEPFKKYDSNKPDSIPF